MEPGHREEYVTYLRSKERWGQAAAELAAIVNDDSFRSIEGKSKHHLWLELCDIITKHPDDVKTLRVDAVIRGGIRKFTTEVCFSSCPV
jgi:pre-mRNA-splicing factor SYF1